MALFNKETERNKMQPQSPPATSAAPSAPAGERQLSAHGPQTAAPPEGRAYLDKGCRISGKLFFEGPTKVDGQVEGEIAASAMLTIGESAVVTAQIKAASVVVAGKVSGDIVASERIEIRPSAKVLGNLTSPILVVHEGAVFEGHCSMQPDRAREDRKVTVFPKEERLAQAGVQKQA